MSFETLLLHEAHLALVTLEDYLLVIIEMLVQQASPLQHKDAASKMLQKYLSRNDNKWSFHSGTLLILGVFI